MGKDYFYYKYSDYLKNHYHEKIYKLPVNLPVSCPNRINGGGCTFCAEKGTGFEAMDSSIPVALQLNQTGDYIRRRYKAKRFIAYFQNYTNTYMPLECLEKYVREAADVPNIVEIDISTRPDCISDDYLKMLASISTETGLAIGIELGLQTVNYHTLNAVNRGHGLAEYIDSCLRIKKYGLLLCSHVILNLPGDCLEDVIETSKIISILQNDLVKIHSLYIAKNTVMGEAYKNHEFSVCTKEDYFLRLRMFLEYLNPQVGVERLFSRIPEKDAFFSNWQTSWWKLHDEFIKYMETSKSYQGKNFNYMNGPALGVFDRF